MTNSELALLFIAELGALSHKKYSHLWGAHLELTALETWQKENVEELEAFGDLIRGFMYR